MARAIYSRPSKTIAQPQRVIAPRKAPRELPIKTPLSRSSNRIMKSSCQRHMAADSPSTYYQGAQHYHGAVKLPPPRRNPPRKTRQVKQKLEMLPLEKYVKLGRNHSRGFKSSEIVSEDEPDFVDCFDDYESVYVYDDSSDSTPNFAPNYASVRRFARELAAFKLMTGWKPSLDATKF